MNALTIRTMMTSFQDNSWSGISKNLTVGQCLATIKTGTYQTTVTRLRTYLSNKQPDLYDQEKRKLPAVTFSACFKEKRNRGAVATYNQLLVLDVDKIDLRRMEEVKVIFRQDPCIMAFWESPSGSGLKGLVYMDFPTGFPNEDTNFRHTYGFGKVREYLSSKYQVELDRSGSDVTRLCFFSYDPALFLREEVIPFQIEYSHTEAVSVRTNIKNNQYTYSAEATLDQKYNPLKKNKQARRTQIQAIIRFLAKRGQSITSNYNDWYQVSFALANTFTYELGLKYFVALSKLDGKAYNEKACVNMINYCYANSLGSFKFATIVHFAKQKGYKEEKAVPKVVEKL